MNKKLLPVFAVAVLSSGCASITGDTVQSIRVETKMADGSELKDADCELFNEYGSFRVRTPGNVMVRRSSSDLNVQCQKENLPTASAKAVSRANSGMWGNIIFGGGIGAVIDHSKGSAYTYPQWMQMTFGKVLSFDRTDDRDGQPSLAKEQGSVAQSPQSESTQQKN
ncbi:MAG: hypothetical protein PHT48_01605 [Dechloromonas sp.]|nr:hypothetical protein [Dechloromonas sp.]